jgi:hypothetical protein
LRHTFSLLLDESYAARAVGETRRGLWEAWPAPRARGALGDLPSM